MYVRLRWPFVFYESAVGAKGSENDRDRSYRWRERSRALSRELFLGLTELAPDRLSRGGVKVKTIKTQQQQQQQQQQLDSFSFRDVLTSLSNNRNNLK